MKHSAFYSLVFFGLSASAAMEVPLKGVYAPVDGYDDNDTVEVVLEGELPNSCHTLAGDFVRVDDRERTIYVSELANRRNDGPCAVSDRELPPEMAAPLPFQRDVQVGRLSAGSYRIDYAGPAGMRTRKLNVVVAPSSSVDSANYALISNAFAASEVSADQPTFEVRLTGSLSSTCAFLKDVQITLEQDVYVVLPIVERKADICMPASIPFYKIVNVPTPAAGRYLLHARSVGGGSKNALFSVR